MTQEEAAAYAAAAAAAYGQEVPDGEDPMDDPDYYDYNADKLAAENYQ